MLKRRGEGIFSGDLGEICRTVFSLFEGLALLPWDRLPFSSSNGSVCPYPRPPAELVLHLFGRLMDLALLLERRRDDANWKSRVLHASLNGAGELHQRTRSAESGSVQWIKATQPGEVLTAPWLVLDAQAHSWSEVWDAEDKGPPHGLCDV